MSEPGLAWPAYSDLPVDDDVGGGVSWDTFGAADNLGTLNFLTADSVLRGVRSAVTGERFCLSLPLDVPNPPMKSRLASEQGVPYDRRFLHRQFKIRPTINDDYLDNFFLQSSTQIDGLRHVGVRGPKYYGRVTEEELVATDRLGVAHIARAGIVARGVLADVTDLASESGWTPQDPIDPATLAATLGLANVTVGRGDALLVRTGYLRDYRAADPSRREDLSEGHESPGLSADEDMAAWLWDMGFSLVGADNPGVEVMPGVKGQFLHRRLIAGLGMPLLEWLDLDALAQAAHSCGRYTFLLFVAPLNLASAAGSPANAVAVL